MKRINSGFTLTEFLVAIAITALLSAILFPVFSRARAKDQQAACASNLKQIYNGLMMYAADYDGNLPLADANQQGYGWALAILPYSTGTKQGNVFPADGIFTCPAAVLLFPSPPNPDHWRLTYGFNIYVGTYGGGSLISGNVPAGLQAAKEGPHADRVVLCMDSLHHSITWPGSEIIWSNPNYTYAHNENKAARTAEVNVLFINGNVRRLKYPEEKGTCMIGPYLRTAGPHVYEEFPR